MTIRFTAVAASVLAASLAQVAPGAAQQPSTLGMTCGQAARTVQARGSVVLATGEYTYDRYVSTRGFCLQGTYARPAFVATRDTPQCSIGFYCSSAPPLFGGD